ncbi:WRN RecQ like helicase isoform X3 [Calliopsis andreniformis]|uniref:WRN RecQ like helicase isoform X3 n=1 Tax=Calliopsis andreniformis TaxID=337506 RepID=UPI003FCD8A01
MITRKLQQTTINDQPKQDSLQVKSLRRSSRNLPKELKENLKEETVIERDPDISLLPSIIFEGHVKYVSDFNNCAMICDEIIKEVDNFNDTIVPIGFDLEWPFSFQTGSGKTALAQICLNNHPKVKLVGVNIKNDIWKLGRDFKEFPAEKVVQNNCLDCGPFANQVFNRSCRWSLEKLTAYVLKKRISKDPKVRKSKWHVHPLSEEQKTYAATDAYVSWLLHNIIQEKANINSKSTEII